MPIRRRLSAGAERGERDPDAVVDAAKSLKFAWSAVVRRVASHDRGLKERHGGLGGVELGLDAQRERKLVADVAK